jgi:hypothetical protein
MFKISKIRNITKFENESEYNVFIGYLPEGKKKIRLQTFIPSKSFAIYENEICFDELVIQFKKPSVFAMDKPHFHE